MTRDTRRLPDAELAVMQALWACQTPAGRSDLEGVLQSTHPMPPPPCSPCCPGWGTRALSAARRSGRSARYTPLVSQEDYLAGQSRRFLDQLCGGSLSTFANALCSSGLTRQELDELRDLLNGGKL